jgi:streptomycin 6-kinase
VAPARDNAGRDLALKLAWQHDEARHEAAGLRAWAGAGAVRLHDHATGDATSILLLERCRPGTPLGEALPEAEQDRIVAGLLKRLWRVPVDPAVFRPLQVMCDAWATEFQQRVAGTPGRLDPGLARAAITLLRMLPAAADRRVLLATDLHAGTSSPPTVNLGWPSTPSPTLATPPTTRCSTCSTANNA